MNRDAISYYQSASSVMEEFCRPLNDYFSIPLFVYFKVYRDGSYIFLSNNIKTTKEYCSKITHDLIYFHNYLENNQNRNLILWPGNFLQHQQKISFENYLFLVIVFLFLLAAYFIKKDDNLVKGADRLR